MELVLKNLKSILISLFLIAFAIIVYLNSSKLVNWFKSLFTNVSVDETPTTKELNTPTYKIDSKIIDNYVEKIINAIGGIGFFGNEKQLDEVYQNLKDTDIANTIAVWNNFKNRNLKYSTFFGEFSSGVLAGKPLNLLTVLENELTGVLATKSKKAAWTNWHHLLVTRAHLS
jgi:hypothetical protein